MVMVIWVGKKDGEVKRMKEGRKEEEDEVLFVSVYKSFVFQAAVEVKYPIVSFFRLYISLYQTSWTCAVYAYTYNWESFIVAKLKYTIRSSFHEQRA